jgi:hypothetical protein
MRKLIIILLCAWSCQIYAQRINRKYNNVSISYALKELNSLQNKYAVNFIYDELEDFKVTTDIHEKSVPDAIQQLIGFYPIKVTQMDNVLLVECLQKTKIRYKGSIVDNNNQPLPYANITLLNPVDSSFITGGVSNESGVFVIPCDNRKVLAKVSFVGCKTVYRLCSHENLGTIKLIGDAKVLEAVNVKGRKPLFTRKEDRTVFHVDQIANSEGLFATDVMKYIPRVVVNGNGTITVANTSTIIFVNDRKLEDSEVENYLKTLLASDIERIEVKEHNTGDQDASLAGGQIFIYMKQKVGFSGYVNQYSRVTTLDGWGLGPTLNLFFGTARWNIYANYSYFRGKGGQMAKTTHNYLYNNTQHFSEQDVDFFSYHHDLKVGGVVNLDAKKKHTIGLEANISINDNDMPAKSKIVFTDSIGNKYKANSDCNSFLHNNMDNVALQYKWKIDENDSYLKALINYNYKYGTNNSDFFADYPTYAQRNASEKDLSASCANNFSGQIDLKKAWKSGWTLTSGAKYEQTDRRNRDNRYDMLNGGALIQPSLYKYVEGISAAYFGMAKTLPHHIYASATLRVEKTNAYGDNRLTGIREIDRSYTDFVPYFYFSQSFDNGWAYNINFNRSLDRPSFSQLSNFYSRLTDALYTCGNPDLQRVINNNLSATLSYKQHSVSLNYLYTPNLICENFVVENGITYHKNLNSGKRTIYLIDYNYTGKIFKWWDANFFISGSYVNTPWSTNIKHLWYGMTAINNDFTFGKIGTFTLAFTAWKRNIDGNTSFCGSGYMDIAYRRSFLKNKSLSLRMGINDLFKGIKSNAGNISPIQHYYFWEQSSTRMAFVSLTYTFKSRHTVKTETIENNNETKDRL